MRSALWGSSKFKAHRRRLEELDTRTAAYIGVHESGRAADQKSTVFTALVRAGGMGATCSELSARTGYPPNEVIARLHDLEKDGAVHRGELERKSETTGVRAIVWYAAKPRGRQLHLEGFR